MSKKTQIATGSRGGKVAGYHVKDGKMVPIYVDNTPEAPKKKSAVPKKKAHDVTEATLDDKNESFVEHATAHAKAAAPAELTAAERKLAKKKGVPEKKVKAAVAKELETREPWTTRPVESMSSSEIEAEHKALMEFTDDLHTDHPDTPRARKRNLQLVAEIRRRNGMETKAAGPKSAVPAKKVPPSAPWKDVKTTEEFAADLTTRLKGSGISMSKDTRVVSIDGKNKKVVDVIRFTGPGGSIQGFVTPAGTVTLFPADRDYLMIGSGSEKNMDASARFITKMTAFPDDAPDGEKEYDEGEGMGGPEAPVDTPPSATSFLAKFREKKQKESKRGKAMIEKVPEDAMSLAKKHLREGGSRKDLLPKMVEHFGGNAKKARRFIRKLHKTVGSLSKSMKAMTPAQWSAAVLEL